ncbi:MAG: hypothetical protein IJ568_06265 [Bacilli bacterium]|nr:hypothetical protein [Bacilli bacterium]
MTAKEMFEKLNYILYEENDINISYRKYPDTKIDDLTYQEIFFNKQSQFIVIVEYNSEGMEEKFTTLKELQAINKQVEELGW